MSKPSGAAGFDDFFWSMRLAWARAEIARARARANDARSGVALAPARPRLAIEGDDVLAAETRGLEGVISAATVR